MNTKYKATSDTARINLSIKKINSLGEINLDSSIAFGLATIEEAKKIEYTKGEADARIRLAGSYDFKGDWKSAEENIMKAGELYKLLKDSAGRATFYSAHGMMLSMQGKLDTAIIYMQKAISLGEELKEKKLLRNVYGNIAIAYYMKSNYPQALSYQQKALRLAEAEKNFNSQAYASLNMALTYKSMGDTARGEEFLLKAVTLGKQTGAPAGSGTGLGLSLSYDIIKAHGGEIKVETLPGEGATFIIQLPVSAV